MSNEAAPRRRVLVTGAAGMLGSQLLLDAPEDVEAVGTDLREPPSTADPESDAAEAPPVKAVGFDLAEPGAVAELFAAFGPFDGVIHAAAYTAVDQAEQEEEVAQRVNARAARVIAEACARAGIPLVLVSTDFVFDGTKGEPYAEDDPPQALGAYGRTKLEGELAARDAWGDGLRIVRTQWLYGPRGSHFPATILRLASERDELRVVDDQVGAPTSTLELAPAIWDVLLKGESGVYHAACEGSCLIKSYG